MEQSQAGRATTGVTMTGLIEWIFDFDWQCHAWRSLRSTTSDACYMVVPDPPWPNMRELEGTEIPESELPPE